MRGEGGGEGGGGEFLGVEDGEEGGEVEEGWRGDVAVTGLAEGEGEPEGYLDGLVGRQGQLARAQLQFRQAYGGNDGYLLLPAHDKLHFFGCEHFLFLFFF